MKARELFLIMLSHSDGRLSGKTLIQKQAYFLNKYLDLGLTFIPHYYGPYCPDLDAAFAQCNALRFAKQSFVDYGTDCNGFEVREFSYELTPDGKEIVELLRCSQRELFDAIGEAIAGIRKAGGTDSGQLANAAKADYVIAKEGVPPEAERVTKVAASYGWGLSPNVATVSLDMLDLLKTIVPSRVKT